MDGIRSREMEIGEMIMHEREVEAKSKAFGADGCNGKGKVKVNRPTSAKGWQI
jgi:hypothetical protein